jgi:hypothetical protein
MLLLPHDLQLLHHLQLALTLQLLHLSPPFFTVFLSQGVQRLSGISQLSQLVL